MRKFHNIAFLVAFVVSLSGCVWSYQDSVRSGVCSGSGNPETSYINRQKLARAYLKLAREQPHDLKAELAHAIADFNGDLRLDLINGPISETTDTISAEVRSNVFGSAAVANFLDGAEAAGVHPRKTIVADLNGDKRPDVFVADHGLDRHPFPGAKNILLLSSKKRKLVRTEFPGNSPSFHHGASAGDIDCDGDIDIAVTGWNSFFLINDGRGNFQKERRSPFDRPKSGLFTAELIDVDRDQMLDLIVGGHEYEGAETAIYWGDVDRGFSELRKTVIPSIPDYEIVVDFLVANKGCDCFAQLFVGRPKTRPFYQGFDIQRITLNPDRTVSSSTTLLSRPSELPWYAWLYAADLDKDGDTDLFAERKGSLLILTNNGGEYQASR